MLQRHRPPACPECPPKLAKRAKEGVSRGGVLRSPLFGRRRMYRGAVIGNVHGPQRLLKTTGSGRLITNSAGFPGQSVIVYLSEQHPMHCSPPLRVPLPAAIVLALLVLLGTPTVGQAQTAEPSPRSGYRIERIVVDPGHGGWDTGAVGPGGTKEKDVTLAVAVRLAGLLDRESAARVYLTRHDDIYVPLRERTLIANRHRADLFISLHCNALEDRSRRGTEIYFCSEKASDRMAELVAQRENSVAREEERKVLRSNLVDVEDILFRLERKLYWQESARIGREIIDRVIPRLGTVNRGVKSANFSVLRTAKMPAILLEIGFISNPEEERALRSDVFQQKVAEAVLHALRPWLGNSL